MKRKDEENRADTVMGSISLILLCVLAAISSFVFFGNEEYIRAVVCLVAYFMFFGLLVFIHK